MKKKVNRIIISAFGSGSGKTSFTMGLIKLLSRKGIKVSSYKCGPDYIDTMFHSKALNVPCRNIDLFLSNSSTVKNILADSEDIAVIEGVMGFYDGIAFQCDASTYHISMETDTPVILVINAKGQANTLNALLYGVLNYTKNNIEGVVLNRVSKSSYEMYKKMIEDEFNIKVFGYIPELKDCTLKSRHLGLITAGEMENIENIINNIADVLEESIDIDALLKTASNAEELEYSPVEIKKYDLCRIGIAYDNAFCFHYKDNINILESLGAEIVYFSPLTDEKLPENIHGIIFYGGYPELYLEQLAGNISFINSLKEYYSKKIPLMAECGGYMYISKNIEGVNTAGLIKSRSIMSNRLQNFGYIYMQTEQESILGEKGMVIPAHEFHYSYMEDEYTCCSIKKPKSKRSWQGVYLSDHVYAGYPHLYYLSNIKIAENFIKKAVEYKEHNL